MPTTTVDAPVRVLRVGDERGSRNQAIVALAVRTAPSAVTRSVFVSVANLDLEPATRRLEVWGDGRLLEARDVRIDAQQRADVIIDDVRARASESSRSASSAADGADPATAPDQLAADDRAWAIVPPDRPREILLVGDGRSVSRDGPVATCPNTSLFGVEAGPTTRPMRSAHRRHGLGPDHLRGRRPGDPAERRRRSLIAPPRTSPTRRR